MRLQTLATVILLAVSVCPAFAQTTRPADLRQQIANGWMPDPALTPGDSLPGVTADTVSAPGYATSTRAVSKSEKDEVFAEYGITTRAPREYEIDHLIPLELGGSNDITNLWPQPYHGAWNAHVKDALEDRLRALVVARKVALDEAQKEIATDWIGSYKRYVGGAGD